MIIDKGRKKRCKAPGQRARHLEFCCKRYMLQARSGRYLVNEHPLSATSWATECMQELKAFPAVQSAETRMCAFGMGSADKHGPGFALKPTRFVTNLIAKANPDMSGKSQICAGRSGVCTAVMSDHLQSDIGTGLS